MKKANLLTILLTFLKIGLFTFGGGYAMISIIEKEIVEKKKWISQVEFLDMVAIAESTPGPIAINSATYIGYKQRGIIGSILATIGVVFPSFVIILGISLFFDSFLKIKWVGYAFHGIQACVPLLIISAGVKLFKGLKKKALNIIIFSLSSVALIILTLLAKDFSTVYYILIAGTIGVIAYLIKTINKKAKAKEIKPQKTEKGGKE